MENISFWKPKYMKYEIQLLMSKIISEMFTMSNYFSFSQIASKFLHVINKSSPCQQNNLKLELILKVETQKNPTQEPKVGKLSLYLRHAFTWDGLAWRLPYALKVASSRLGAIEDETKARRWGGTGRSSHLKPWRREIENDRQ